MNLSKVFSLFLVLIAVFVLVVFLYFVFGRGAGKSETTTDKSTPTKAAPATPAAATGSKVLNVLTHFSDDRANLLKSSLGESYLVDARSKATSYSFNGVTVAVSSGNVSNQPGYTKYTHVLPTPFKGERIVFDSDMSHEFFEHPVRSVTAYFWFNSLLFLTFTTESAAQPPVRKYYHFASFMRNELLKWEKFDRDPNTELDLSVLCAKLDESNVALGNAILFNLDQYQEEPTGMYSTMLNGVSARFHLTRRSSSSTGFVKMTHKLLVKEFRGPHKPFKLKKLHVSGTELSDVVLTTKPVVSVSVFWWYNMPLLAELDLHGGEQEHLVYNVDTNAWEMETVERLRAKLFLLRNKLGDPLTLDLSRVGDEDQTYTSNSVLVRVSPGATTFPEVKKYTHRFTTGNSHFVGSFVNALAPQMGLPVVRVVEVTAYCFSGVPLLLKMNMATAGSLSPKFRFYANDGYGFWSLVAPTKEHPTTESLIKKLLEENKRLFMLNEKYVLDATMRNNYLTSGRVVEVRKQNFTTMPGYSLYLHQALGGLPFNFAKFTVGGKELDPQVSVPVVGAVYAKVYLFINTPLLVHVHGSTSDSSQASIGGFDHYYSFNSTTGEWVRVATDLSTEESLKTYLSELRATLSSVVINLGHVAGEYKSGLITVEVTDATPFENDPPTSFTKRVHTLKPEFPVDRFKHFDFDLVLAKRVDSSPYEKVSSDALLSTDYVVSKVEVYFKGDVPLHFVVYVTHGMPIRYSNHFQGNLWRVDDSHTRMPLADHLTALAYELRSAAKFDVCKDAPSETVLTYKLKHLGSKETTDVTVTKSEGPSGVTLLTHKLPDNVSLKFTTLTCGDHLLTGLGSDEVSKVVLYRRNRLPLFVKLNSDPRFFELNGEGGLERFLPPDGATDLSDEQVNEKVATLSKAVGDVFDLNMLAKEAYKVDEHEFEVTSSTVGSFTRFMHTHLVKKALTHFTLRSVVHGGKEAALFPTGLQVVWVAVFFKGDEPFYFQVKENGPLINYVNSGKHHHFVYDNGLWLPDGVHENYDDEDMTDRLESLKHGLGNELVLDLSEEAENPLFDMDMAELELVHGLTKHTFHPKALEYPLLLKSLRAGEQEFALPLAEKHLKNFTAYSYRKNFLFFHAVTYDDRDEFFKTNFRGSFDPVTFDLFTQDALKTELQKLKTSLGNQLTLELARKTSYPYHSFVLHVSRLRDQPFDDFEKYLHDLREEGASVPFKLVSVKNNGHVTNLPPLDDLVYFAYVYMSGDDPLMLELHTSTLENAGYNYYYFVNNLGNWEILDNPSLNQLDRANLREMLRFARNKLSKTFKVDLERKFSYRFTNEVSRSYVLEATVNEDARETSGFTLYTHSFELNRQAGEGRSSDVAPTASVLGAKTSLYNQRHPENREGTNEATGTGLAVTSVPRGVIPMENADSTVPGQPHAASVATYQTLKANVLRAVNEMAPALPVAGKFMLGDKVLPGLGVDTVLKANVYWYHDKVPALVHLLNGVHNKYYAVKGDSWALMRKTDQPLARADLVYLLNEAKKHVVEPVEIDLDKTSDFDTYVKYVSNDFTLKAVPTYSFYHGYKGFSHFSATHAERAFRVDKMTLWGDVVLSDLKKRYVRSVTVFTDPNLLPLVVELEWTLVNNKSFVKKYNYFKNAGTAGWVPYKTDNAAERLVDDMLQSLLLSTKNELGEHMVVSLDKRENYGSPTSVSVKNEPLTRTKDWNGYHKITHDFTNTTARVLMLKMGERVVRALHTATYFKSVDAFWYRNSLLLVRVTVSRTSASFTTVGMPLSTTADEYRWFRNDYKDDLVPLDPPTEGHLAVDRPSRVLEDFALPFREDLHLDVAEKTLRNASGYLKFLPSLQVFDTSVPDGYSRYNLYILDMIEGVRLGKLLYHGRDFTTDKLELPKSNVHSIYAFSPVGHFSPFFLEFQSRARGELLLYYFHLNQYGEWVKLETGGRRLTNNELYTKLSLLSSKFEVLTLVDVSKTEGSYYGLNRMDVTKFEFPGLRGFYKYLHRSSDGSYFTVSKFVNKGVVLLNMPVLKVSHVAVYTTRHNRPLLLELKMGGRYRFFTCNANGEWFEDRLPSGDIKAALDAVYDEHDEVARLTGDLVNLQLHAGFVREYVMSEGTVAEFEGSVAVPGLDREPVPVPLAERLLAEDPESGELSSLLSQRLALRQAALRESQAPPHDSAVHPPTHTATGSALDGALAPPLRNEVPVTAEVMRSHVLNPAVYVESDKMSYSYCTLGKVMFVTRRDDVFRGYNVTVHRMANNEPFRLRKLHYLGRAFDLAFSSSSKLLAATLYSAMGKPLLLELVLLNGAQRFFSFDFSNQSWESFTVTDLEYHLDQMNFRHNRSLVLDLAMDTNYAVHGQELVVRRETFADRFTKVSTKLRAAVDAEDRAQSRRRRERQKRVDFKQSLQLEMDKKKAVLDGLKVLGEKNKAMLLTFRAMWKTLKPAEVEEFVELEKKMDLLDDLEDELADLQERREEVRGSGSNAYTELGRRITDTKVRLDRLSTEVEVEMRRLDHMNERELDALDTANLDEIKEALVNANLVTRTFRKQLRVKDKLDETLVKVKEFLDTLASATDVTAQREALDATYNTCVKLSSASTNSEMDFTATLGYSRDLKTKIEAFRKDQLTSVTNALTKQEAALKAVAELKSFAELAKKLLDARVTNNEIQTLHSHPDDSSLYSERLKAALELANRFDKHFRFPEQLKKADKLLADLEAALPMVDLLKTALTEAESVAAEAGVALRALKEYSPGLAKFTDAYNVAKAYRDGFLSGADLNLELTFSTLDLAEMTYGKVKEALVPLADVQNAHEKLKKLKEVATQVKNSENLFTSLKAALKALDPDLPPLESSLAGHLAALENNFSKLHSLPSVLSDLKKALANSDINGLFDDNLRTSLRTLAHELTSRRVEDFHVHVDKIRFFKNLLKDAFDIDSAAVSETKSAIDYAKSVFNDLKPHVTAVANLSYVDSLSGSFGKLGSLLQKARKFDEVTDLTFGNMKNALDGLGADGVAHTVVVAVAYRRKSLSDASEKLVLELKSEATRTVEMAVDVVTKLNTGQVAVGKVEDALKAASKFKAVYDSLASADYNNVNPSKFKVFHEAASLLKAALLDAPKLKEGYLALKMFRSQLQTENYLDRAIAHAEKFNELFNLSEGLSVAVDKVLEFTLADESAPDYEPVKTHLIKIKTNRDVFNMEDSVNNIKTIVDETRVALNDVAAVFLKLGLIVGKHKYKRFLGDLKRAQKHYDTAKNRHDRYDIDPEMDNDEDPETLRQIMFALGGLRHAGKDLSFKGLPLGSHLHTLNAYYTPGFQIPLVLHFKYKESLDEDEPSEQVLMSPPTSDALSDADLSRAPAQIPGAQVQQSSTVQQVESLLEQGLRHLNTKVITESAPVLSHNTPVRTQRNKEETEPVIKKFAYPGRFLVYDADGTWKPFVPDKRGALRAKLEELKVAHALGVNLDLGVVPGARKAANYHVNSERLMARRVVYSSAYSLNRSSAQLQGASARAHVFNLTDFDQSVKMFPPLDFQWFVHHKPPKLSGDVVVDSLPEFDLQRLSFNGSKLNLSAAAQAVLTGVNSVSAVFNPLGAPMYVFVYKTTRHEGVLQHAYTVLSLRGDVYEVDDSFGNYNNLLYKLEHSNFSWTSDNSFDAFAKMFGDKLNEMDRMMQPSYVIDLGATAHYKRGQVVVHVETLDAFGVKHVSFTPGLVPLANEVLPPEVPPFTLHKVFLGDTVFKGFKAPFRNVLHVTAFHTSVMLPVAAHSSLTTVEKFPLLVELSTKNEFNRLENFYYRYVGGDKFELLVKTKLRFTAAEVADVLNAVVYQNLRAGVFNSATLNLDFAVKTNHFTPSHKLTVEKMPRFTPPASGTGLGITNSLVPEHHVLYKYTLPEDFASFSLVLLSFGPFWTFTPEFHRYKEFYAYVRDGDTFPVLLGAVYFDRSAEKNVMWYGFDGAVSAVTFATPPDPATLTGASALSPELARLAANVDYLLQPKLFEFAAVAEGETVKLSPVGGLKGMPETAEARPHTVAATTPKPAAEVTTTPKAAAEPVKTDVEEVRTTGVRARPAASSGSEGSVPGQLVSVPVATLPPTQHVENPVPQPAGGVQPQVQAQSQSQTAAAPTTTTPVVQPAVVSSPSEGGQSSGAGEAGAAASRSSSDAGAASS